MNISTYRIRKMSPLFHVTNLERSVEFYTKLLGFDIEFRYEDFYVGIVKDGCSLHLKSGKTSDDTKRDMEALDIIFSAEDIEGLYQKFSSKRIKIIQPLREMAYGKEFYVEDPDSHIIGFLQA